MSAAVAILYVPSKLHAQEQALADQENWSATQQEVWEQEEAFWTYLSAGETDRFMRLWDEHVIDWPSSEARPISRSAIRRALEEVPTGSDLRYELEPLAVNVYSNSGITFYRVIHKNEKGEATGAGRLTHTWRRHDGEWKIIGGMSDPASDTASWKR